MKALKKRHLKQIAFNHSSDINFIDFMNLFQKSTAKSYSLLVIDATLASEYPSRFRNNLLETIQKIIVTIDNKSGMKNYNMILTEKQQKHQYYQLEKLIRMNMLQAKVYFRLIRDKAKFIYSPLSKALGKPIKTIQDQGKNK